MQVQFWYPEKEGTEGRQGSDTTVWWGINKEDKFRINYG
jgi:hypothetical protein